MNKNMFRVGLAVVCMILVFASVLIQCANADWVMFRSDPSHSGAGTGNPLLTPTLLWKSPIGDCQSSPTVVGGVVYTGSDYGVYALNATSGIQLWNYSTGGGDSSPAVVNGVVYIGSQDGNVYALNATTGGKLWKYPTGNSVYSSPAVVNGKVYIGSMDGKVYALNATTGTQLWNYTTWDKFYSSPAVVNGIVYIGSWDFNVYALNATTGGQLWNYPTSRMIWSSPAVVGGLVYIGSRDGNVYALNSTTGIKIWKFATPSSNDICPIPIQSSPAIADGVVYIGSWDSTVYALNATTGIQLWNYTTGDMVESSPAVVGGVVYIGSYDSNLYALNASNGAKLWNYTTGRIHSSPAVVGGLVYIGSLDGNVYALGGPAISVSPSSWVMNVGQSKTFTASASGGSGVYTRYQWYVDGIAQSSEIGSTFSFSPASIGSYSVTVTVTDSLGVISAQSSPALVTVNKKSTQISVLVEAPSATVGSAVNIKGNLLDLFGNRLQDKTVTLSYSVEGSNSWIPIGSGATNAFGEYNIQWFNTASGTFTLKTEWSGNADYLGTSNTTMISVLPYENQNIFFIESNSTVTALAFNSTSSELSFSVNGTSGTTGYVKVTIAKNLIQNPENIKVSLDENQLTYELTSNTNTWLLIFTYHHSTHQINIDLTAAKAVSSPSPSPSPSPILSSTLTPIATLTPTSSPTALQPPSPTPTQTAGSSPNSTSSQSPTPELIILLLSIIIIASAGLVVYVKKLKHNK